MPTLKTKGGVKLHYEETGTGTPVIFVHEFAGDGRSWEPQVRYFSRSYRCITFNARGYPPSDVPSDRDMYSQDHARDDILGVLDGLDIKRAHIVGLSMGGFATLHFGLAYPERALSMIVAGCGYGAGPDVRAQFVQETDARPCPYLPKPTPPARPGSNCKTKTRGDGRNLKTSCKSIPVKAQPTQCWASSACGHRFMSLKIRCAA